MQSPTLIGSLTRTRGRRRTLTAWTGKIVVMQLKNISVGEGNTYKDTDDLIFFLFCSPACIVYFLSFFCFFYFFLGLTCNSHVHYILLIKYLLIFTVNFFFHITTKTYNG